MTRKQTGTPQGRGRRPGRNDIIRIGGSARYTDTAFAPKLTGIAAVRTDLCANGQDEFEGPCGPLREALAAALAVFPEIAIAAATLHALAETTRKRAGTPAALALLEGHSALSEGRTIAGVPLLSGKKTRSGEETLADAVAVNFEGLRDIDAATAVTLLGPADGVAVSIYFGGSGCEGGWVATARFMITFLDTRGTPLRFLRVLKTETGICFRPPAMSWREQVGFGEEGTIWVKSPAMLVAALSEEA